MKRLLVLIAALSIGPSLALAHEGHLHRYMGTIATAAGSQLSLETRDGKTVTFKLDEKTRITRGKAGAGVKDLEPGARAVVEAEGGKEPVVAKTIKLGPAAQGK